MNATDLAAALNVSKARVSQYVSQGKLAGCYSGDGRNRRFDLAKVREALGRELHPGQMLGNGASTRRALRDIGQDGQTPSDVRPASVTAKAAQRADAPLKDDDEDGYALARRQKAEEEVRRLRRLNAEAEGAFVLAAEVTRATQRLIAQEVAEFEAVLRDGARKVADQLGVDFKVVRQVLTDHWRAHRQERSAVLSEQAMKEGMTEAEQEADI